MEGPTPSSAIFYGALSIHAGAHLLLRAQPLIQASVIVTTSVIIIGTLTAIHGTMVGRACADAKTSIGYAAMTQLGLIFVEIGLGLKWIALFHITSHAIADAPVPARHLCFTIITEYTRHRADTLARPYHMSSFAGRASFVALPTGD
jgi:NADH:ubiquinone oxidoreductase subunit 5 (subunit L)/multisubunit Na+/H+ antiporter MnhA subunit